MTTFQELTARVARAARLSPPDRAEVWVRTGASMLRDWGGEAVDRSLRGALPDEAFRGGGTSGLSWESAVARVGEQGEASAVQEEAARRATEPDPFKAVTALRVVWGAFKAELSDEAIREITGALPEPAAHDWAEASLASPWSFRLIPQSYKRPDEIRIGHHH